MMAIGNLVLHCTASHHPGHKCASALLDLAITRKFLSAVGLVETISIVAHLASAIASICKGIDSESGLGVIQSENTHTYLYQDITR
jgi:hypothetical protein